MTGLNFKYGPSKKAEALAYSADQQEINQPGEEQEQATVVSAPKTEEVQDGGELPAAVKATEKPDLSNQFADEAPQKLSNEIKTSVPTEIKTAPTEEVVSEVKTKKTPEELMMDERRDIYDLIKTNYVDSAEAYRKEAEEEDRKTKEAIRKSLPWAGAAELVASLANLGGVLAGGENQKGLDGKTFSSWMQKADADAKERKLRIDKLRDAQRAASLALLQTKLAGATEAAALRNRRQIAENNNAASLYREMYKQGQQNERSAADRASKEQQAKDRNQAIIDAAYVRADKSGKTTQDKKDALVQDAIKQYITTNGVAPSKEEITQFKEAANVAFSEK